MPGSFATYCLGRCIGEDFMASVADEALERVEGRRRRAGEGLEEC